MRTDNKKKKRRKHSDIVAGSHEMRWEPIERERERSRYVSNTHRLCAPLGTRNSESFNIEIRWSRSSRDRAIPGQPEALKRIETHLQTYTDTQTNRDLYMK